MLQSDLPGCIPYLPDAHNVHESLVVLIVVNDPGLQPVHILDCAAPFAVWKNPGEQSKQSLSLECPVPVWYVPGAHKEQFPLPDSL